MEERKVGMFILWAPSCVGVALRVQLHPALSASLPLPLRVCGCVFVSYHTLGGLKQQKCVSHFWRLEVWNEGVGRAMISLTRLRKDTSLSLWGFQCLLATLGVPWFVEISPSSTWCSSCVSSPFVIRMTVILDEGLPSMTSSWLGYNCKDSLSK